MIWEAVFLAGGKVEKDFASFGDLPSKAYLPLNGKWMGELVLEILRKIPRLRRILAVAPPYASPFSGTTQVPSGSTLLDSLSSGFTRLLPETEMALVVPCDLPCLSRGGVEDFLNQCEAAKAGFLYSYVSRADSERFFPGVSHTYVTLREGQVCGGGLIAIVPKYFPSLKQFAGRATAGRKNIFALAGILGFSFLLKLALGKLSIEDAEKRATELFGFPAKGIQSRFPEIAFNVDDTRTFRQALRFCKENVNH